jgi:hypothetical protein
MIEDQGGGRSPLNLESLLQSGPAAVKVEDYAPEGIEELKGREQIAGMRADRTLRIGMAVALTVLFVVMNGVVVCLIVHGIEMDSRMITEKMLLPADRLVTEKVYISLVGATVVQLSSILFAIARYLFPAAASAE